MVNEFVGVTFPRQPIRPAYDANARKRISSDCIVSGCSVSYSGFSLALSEGFLLACGRLLQHRYDQSWTLAPNGAYARLILSIDVAWNEQAEASHEISTAIEYADSVDTFAAPMQDDINSGGARYQCVVCTVSVGSEGITGYVEMIENREVL